MQRIFANISKQLSNNSKSLLSEHPHFQKCFSSITKLSSFTNYSLKNSTFVNNPCHNFSSAQSNSIFSSKVDGFLANPLLSKNLMSILSSTHFRVSINKLTDSNLRLFRSQLGRGFSGFDSGYNSYRRGWRSWINRTSPDNVVLGLILANVGVFMLWRISNEKFMAQNFMISLDNFKSGRVHTLITSAFSHMDIGHIVSNMVGLYFFGSNIARTFGPDFLIKLYLAGAIGGSIFFLVHKAYMSLSHKGERMFTKDPSRMPGLGASGAVNAIMLLDIFLHPRATLYFDFIIPVPAILLGIFLIGKDMLRVMEGDPRVSGSAHLGGAAVAALAYARIRRGRF